MSLEPVKVDDEINKAFHPSASSLVRLRYTVLAQLLIVSLIPLVALSWYFRRQFFATLEARSHALLGTTAAGHAETIDRLIASKVATLRSLAHSSVFQLPPSKPEINALLAILRDMDETILDIGVFDADGNHVRYAGPFEFLEGRSYRGEEWFRRVAAAESAVYISDIYLGYRGRPHFIIAVRTTAGGRSWYLRITINPDRFNDIVDNVRLVEGAHAFIVNRTGVFQSVPASIGTVLERAPLLPALDGAQGIREVRGAGGPYLVAWSSLREVDWKLIVRQEVAHAYGPARRTAAWVLVIVLTSLVFIVAASIYATRTLVRRYSRSERDRARLVEQLFQAGKLSTLGEMAAGMAHEINNPLAVIVAETGLMEDYLDPTLGPGFDRAEFLGHLKSIKEEAYRCREVTHKLLGFARRTESRIGEVDLNRLTDETVDLVNMEIALENIEIVIERSARPLIVMTDAGKVRQVLLNLVRNAADAIGKDGRITISILERRECAGLRVTDTGCGIPPEHQAKLFMPFFTTKAVGKGTGLGLSISHGIITSLGGRIGVSSRVGEGSAFLILLPRRFDPKAPPDAAAMEKELQAVLGSPAGRG
ncbi:MAG: hypothetical protein HY906_18325 [Deltaproteobacteria bacterium]|nr:hypothetical protein [Deltaproteobacteria bacterium]